MKGQLLKLIRDTICYLKQEKESVILANPDQKKFFQKEEQLLKRKKIGSAPVKNLSSLKLKTPPPFPKEIPKKNPAEFIELEKPKPAADSQTQLKNIISKIAPDLSILSNIPDDKKAKITAEHWKYTNQAADITVLGFRQTPQQAAFLKHLAKALDISFYPARYLAAASLENSQKWDIFLTAPRLKLIIICDRDLWAMPNLMQFYKEYPRQKQSFLNKIPLFLLPDAALYLKDPQLKPALYAALNEKIRRLNESLPCDTPPLS